MVPWGETGKTWFLFEDPLVSGGEVENGHTLYRLGTILFEPYGAMRVNGTSRVPLTTELVQVPPSRLDGWYYTMSQSAKSKLGVFFNWLDIVSFKLAGSLSRSHEKARRLACDYVTVYVSDPSFDYVEKSVRQEEVQKALKSQGFPHVYMIAAIKVAHNVRVVYSDEEASKTEGDANIGIDGRIKKIIDPFGLLEDILGLSKGHKDQSDTKKEKDAVNRELQEPIDGVTGGGGSGSSGGDKKGSHGYTAHDVMLGYSLRRIHFDKEGNLKFREYKDGNFITVRQAQKPPTDLASTQIAEPVSLEDLDVTLNGRLRDIRVIEEPWADDQTKWLIPPSISIF